MIATLLMLIAVLMLGISAAQLAMLGEKTSRNEFDREIAFQAAEAALIDAELHIERVAERAAERVAQPSSVVPAWASIDFDAGSPAAQSIAFGAVTGRGFPVGRGALPSRLPRYVIDTLPDNRAGESADKPARLYRITAVGYGMRDVTQVVLQSFYRKAN